MKKILKLGICVMLLTNCHMWPAQPTDEATRLAMALMQAPDEATTRELLGRGANPNRALPQRDDITLTPFGQAIRRALEAWHEIHNADNKTQAQEEFQHRLAIAQIIRDNAANPGNINTQIDGRALWDILIEHFGDNPIVLKFFVEHFRAPIIHNGLNALGVASNYFRNSNFPLDRLDQPLILQTFNEEIAAIQWLAEHTTDVNTREIDAGQPTGNTVLINILSQLPLDNPHVIRLVETLLARGASANDISEDGIPALGFAAPLGAIAITRLLVQAGVSDAIIQETLTHFPATEDRTPQQQETYAFLSNPTSIANARAARRSTPAQPITTPTPASVATGAPTRVTAAPAIKKTLAAKVTAARTTAGLKQQSPLIKKLDMQIKKDTAALKKLTAQLKKLTAQLNTQHKTLKSKKLKPAQKKKVQKNVTQLTKQIDQLQRQTKKLQVALKTKKQQLLKASSGQAHLDKQKAALKKLAKKKIAAKKRK